MENPEVESVLDSPQQILLEREGRKAQHFPVLYDPEVDVFRIIFSNVQIEESDEEKPGIILDYDEAGNIIGIEIIDASKRIDNPCSVEYSVSN
ncbi:DUF2283 domain-containing protein [Aphanizomenon flos-aquae NRERC-008]|jgi:uncharacterized protein YuzE|uniref:DUF2283 domain-containing protein n=1 Tax=Aphanizomenon flos-aquae FACHB-1249 TaxID=2692889 RepID=A0ABR8IWW0_APHFL|nr:MULTISPECIES: DUF2283 domain-containing protein [Aphanizomenon]MCE2906720.1 DUF2283 domain-containing protein [Anabaena sp. CoA2_C59]MDJ0504602.1 DUF2283 domain-containing protein [Nostocales cyanobacterium LE14-WE12]MBD2392303.1 DUF2283 domain-containing protein [Aphanizomenon flos-aquae FACHB-1171]MBD2558438.1 DUF2283 domain-containing protein [Aphanizomenon flos-aquae FACHB-1290]MBD2633374.1 DUF2283 domain-containing protein [Aphanizomenon sp. FACHB-1399]